jgi:hypothetical protein
MDHLRDWWLAFVCEKFGMGGVQLFFLDNWALLKLLQILLHLVLRNEMDGILDVRQDHS